MTTPFLRNIAIIFLAIFSLLSGYSQQADVIIFNANIYTVNEDQPFAEALAIKGNLIAAVGQDESILKLKEAHTKLIDAEGQFIMPGLIEGHGHFHSLGTSLMNLRLQDTKSWHDIVDSVRIKVQKAEPGEWITGRGWHQEKWNIIPEKNLHGFPFHDELSKISPDNPVVLRHASGHLLIANKKAMDLAGINSGTISPSGGEILKDEYGNPSGIFNETAMDLMSTALGKSIEDQSEKEKKKYWKKSVQMAQDKCLSLGITSFQDAGSSFEDIRYYSEMAERNELKTRLWVMLNDDMEIMPEEIAKHIKLFNNMFFKFGGIKAYMDGALGSYGALLLEPYSDNPGTCGHQIISLQDLEILADHCLQNSLQLCTHAIGDKGNRLVLNTYKNKLDNQDRRWRIEHAQHLHPDDILRFTDIGVIAAMQPIHCTSDAPFVEKRLGKERARKGAYVWRSLLEEKTHLNLGTDVPVEDIDPYKNIYAACTRFVDATGDHFYMEQKLTREEALYYYTMGNAYSVFQENIKGSVEVGKLADLILLDRDLLKCPDEEVPEVKVKMTIVDGKVEYRKK